MLKLFAGSIARTVSAAVSGWLLAHGLAAQGDTAIVEQVVGAVVVFALAQLWSLLHKAGKVKA